MWKATKIILLLILAAFVAGLMPTIIDFLSGIVVYSAEKGFYLHPDFLGRLLRAFQVIKNYAWQITLIYACVIGCVIFMEGQNPDRTILWLVTLILVPVIGVLLYLLLGPDFKSIKNRKLFKPPKVKYIDNTPFTDDKDFLIGRLLHASSGANLTRRNRVRILNDGEETFGAIKEALRAAKTYIHMEYYIIRDDELGHEIRDILAEAVKRGVSVRVLYDAVGSWKLKRGYVQGLIDAGIQCRSFMPVSFPMFRRRTNFRNHRKIVVVDSKIAFTGGLNIGDEYLGKGPLGFWRDTHVSVEGEAVAELHKIFLRDWCMRTGEKPEDLEREVVCDDCGPEIEHDFSDLPVIPVQVVPSSADDPWHSILQGYFAMISRAQERVWITTPYLVPGLFLMNAMTAAAMAGVDVRVIMPAKKDHFLVFWGSRGNVEPLLRAGVRVFLYKKGFVHAKSLLADDDICSVGTCNMDVRSLEINFEDQLFIYDNSVNGRLAEQYLIDLRDSEEIEITEWERRPLWQKVLEAFGRLYSAQI